jgi:hypothetical protein
MEGFSQSEGRNSTSCCEKPVIFIKQKRVQKKRKDFIIIGLMIYEAKLKRKRKS